MLSELRGRWRRRERVAVAGPPSLTDGENMTGLCGVWWLVVSVGCEALLVVEFVVAVLRWALL